MRVFFLLLIVLLPRMAASQDVFHIGPWNIGDTREKVLEATEFGPFEPVALTGGLETRHARFLDSKVTVSFVFDASDRVEYIQVWLYEGTDFAEAKKASLGLFDLFSSRFGGASVPGIEVSGAGVDGSTSLDRISLGIVLDRVLGQAPKLGEDFKRKHKVVATTVLDLIPHRNPLNAKLTAQLVHASRHDAFYVFLFLDQTTAPDRRVASNVKLEKL
ncbi:hypothetical protein ACQQ2N_06130 [Dokdonella sp. MW10]|uniref:hypothetical protein n=1 Tax=Dokdonella sp. MW10 TaxID=2992926 RepID=UPI003F8018B2